MQGKSKALTHLSRELQSERKVDAASEGTVIFEEESMWLRTLFLTSLYFFGCAEAVCQRPVYQLRIYKLHAGNEQHFHERFRQQCMPIMRRYGFDIVFTSESGEAGAQGLCLSVALEGSRHTKRGLEELSCGPEWVEIKRVTAARWGDLVDEVQDRSLDLLPYTPKPSQVP